MRLLPRELDCLLVFHAGSLAQKRLARGLKLNQPEATALIAAVVSIVMRLLVVVIEERKANIDV